MWKNKPFVPVCSWKTSGNATWKPSRCSRGWSFSIHGSPSICLKPSMGLNSLGCCLYCVWKWASDPECLLKMLQRHRQKAIYFGSNLYVYWLKREIYSEPQRRHGKHCKIIPWGAIRMLLLRKNRVDVVVAEVETRKPRVTATRMPTQDSWQL